MKAPRLADPINLLVRAVAMSNEYFHGERIAIHANEEVLLEFRLRDVVVHSEPDKPEVSTILFTYWLTLGAFQRKQADVLKDGKMPGPAHTQFLLFHVRHEGKKRSECGWCGKGWQPAISEKEAHKHEEEDWSRRRR